MAKTILSTNLYFDIFALAIVWKTCFYEIESFSRTIDNSSENPKWKWLVAITKEDISNSNGVS